MAEIRDLAEAFSWPVARLANCFGIHRQTLSKRIKEAGLKPSGTYRGNPVYEISEIARLLWEEPEDDEREINFDRDPKARKDWFQSENERLKFEKEQRELIPVGEVEEAVATTYAVIAHLLRSIPDSLERKRGIAGEVVEAVEQEIIEIQYTLADRLSALADVVEEDEQQEET